MQMNALIINRLQESESLYLLRRTASGELLPYDFSELVTCRVRPQVVRILSVPDNNNIDMVTANQKLLMTLVL